MPIPNGSVRAISFDYGHVLGGLDFDDLAARFVELGRARGDIARMRGALGEAYRAHDQVIAAAGGHEAAWRALMSALVRAGVDVQERDTTAIVAALWDAQPSRNLWRFVPDEARTLLDALAAAKVPMAITSNSEGRVRELLEEIGIAHYFLGILDSGVLGFGKPDRRIFERVGELLGAPLANIVHVGDSESADIVGAKSAGAFAIRFDAFVPGASERATIADARLDDYASLRRTLEDALGRAL